MEAPPTTWQEHWFEHNQLVKLKYYDDYVAIYFDDDMSESEASWLYDYVSKIAKYIRQAYGDIRSDRLYAIFHKNKYYGGHPDFYYSSMHDYRNVIDCGSSDWSEPDFNNATKGIWRADIVLHEAAHIVEFTVHGKKNSPAFNIWKDSKWSEFFEYGFHNEVGSKNYANVKFREFMDKSDSFPKPNTQWFKNWFYPLYSNFGGSKVMRDFYQLIEKYYPYENKDMNWGEYLLFTFGACKERLDELVETAFGWSEEWRNLFNEAATRFPAVTKLFTETTSFDWSKALLIIGTVTLSMGTMAYIASKPKTGKPKTPQQ